MKNQIIKSIKKNYKSLEPTSFTRVRTLSTHLYIGQLLQGRTWFTKIDPLETWSIKELLDLWLRVMWIKIFNRGLYY